MSALQRYSLSHCIVFIISWPMACLLC